MGEFCLFRGVIFHLFLLFLLAVQSRAAIIYFSVRSPITPSKRASFHAYSPAKLPKPPVPPSSPSLKHVKPSLFSCRKVTEPSSTRTVSPMVSPRVSPSPSLTNRSLQSTESCESGVQPSPPSSPTVTRRRLPDTPAKQRNKTQSGEHHSDLLHSHWMRAHNVLLS